MNNQPYNVKIFYDYSDQRLKRIAVITVVLFVALNILFNLLPAPVVDRKAAKELPPRLTKMVLEKRLPPPPEPKPEEKKEEEPNTFLKCGRCVGVVYCSKKCQKFDWKQHKRTCQFKSG